MRTAVETIPDLVQVSSLYETDPIGGPDQGAFLNCVVELDTDLTPRELSSCAAASKLPPSRVRIERWGPRTLDVDVVYVDGEVVNEPDLIVPHPRWRDRAFVMIRSANLRPTCSMAGLTPTRVKFAIWGRSDRHASGPHHRAGRAGQSFRCGMGVRPVSRSNSSIGMRLLQAAASGDDVLLIATPDRAIRRGRFCH